MRFKRSAGILVHPTSLPGSYGIGELGKEAYAFIDLLVESGQSLWQILPLGPTGYGDSPYACFSALAGNPLLIGLDDLVEEGDVDPADLAQVPDFPVDRVDFGPVITFKTAILRRAARVFREKADNARRAAFDRFCRQNADWLDDFALFMALKDAHGGAVWNTWERGLVTRQPEVMAAWRERLDESVFAQRYCQFQLFKQWTALKAYANDKGIQIVGDILDLRGLRQRRRLGAPRSLLPGSEPAADRGGGRAARLFQRHRATVGQSLYRWDVMAEDGYTWWVRRFSQTLSTVDIVRLDHFRGFAAYWAVPAGEPTAINGQWRKGPSSAFFAAIRDALGELPIIAEDLGHITGDVLELRETFSLPGMNVLFAFATDAGNPYLPHNLEHNSVIYTGTHDNDTTMGWYATREEPELQMCLDYIGPTTEPITWA